MADKSSLRLIGALYGGITAVIALIACMVVFDHVSGRTSLEGSGQPVVTQISAATR